MVGIRPPLSNMPMYNRKMALAIAAQHGITVFRSGPNELQCDAPPHHLISGTDCHTVICFGWDDLGQRIAQGVEPCEDNECDCRDISDDPNVTSPEAYASSMRWELIHKGLW